MGIKSSLTIQDIALVQMQGGTVGSTVEYPGFSNRRNAEKAAQRDLRSMALPLVSCTIYCGQEAADLDIGDVFALAWPDYHDGIMIMRVTGMAFGDGRTDRIRINCVQDVIGTFDESDLPESFDSIFGPPNDGIISIDNPNLWQNPSVPPVRIINQMIEEMPYWLLLLNYGISNVGDWLKNDKDGGIVIVAAERTPNASSAEIKINGEQVGQMGFSPVATIDSSIGYTDTQITLRFSTDLSRVRAGSFAQINDELLRVDAVLFNSITVGRGILDTVPQPHPAGSVIWFWQDFAGNDINERTANDEVSAVLVAQNSQGKSPPSPEMNLTLGSRAIRPYPPGNVRVNGTAYPGDAYLPFDQIEITWAHRSRLIQTETPFLDTTAASIGPEPGVMYRLIIRNEQNVTVVNEAIIGTSWDESITPLNPGKYYVSLWSIRFIIDDAYDSWQTHVFSFIKPDLTKPFDFECDPESTPINNGSTVTMECL